MDDDEDILREFLVESLEILDQLDREFVELESDSNSRERIASIFRAAHTIKGTAGLLGFKKLEAVTHAGENILVRLRDGKLALSAEITSALLCMVDAIRALLKEIESGGGEGESSYPDLIVELERLATGVLRPLPTEPAVSVPQVALPQSGPQPRAADDASLPTEPPRSLGELFVGAEEPVPLDTSVEVSVPASAKEEQVPRAPSTAARDAELTPPARHAPDAVEKSHDESSAAGPREGSVRVDVALLDKLMNLVGELVLARNQVLQCSNRAEDATLTAASQRLNLITTELQEGIMKTRMQPIGNVWAKFPRIVRDLAISCGKKVNLEVEGKETELDRTIIEAIRDPLTHIVRNSVDHGLETPEARRSAGKPEVGTVEFRAFHEGGMVNIEVTDDGRGIDVDAVKAKAVERGLVTQEGATRMTDREALALIFQAGFSTAKQVTNVSGRGVGMDVVKSKVERIGGTVDVHSVRGEGSSIRLKIPLTLAIIPALLVTSRAQRYAIPQVSLVELVRVNPDEGQGSIEFIRSAPVYRLRGELLPLVFLSTVLQRAVQDGSKPDRADLNIVVLQADGRQFGLVVDAIEDTQEIVVKPLGRELKGISCFAGATIMGDGRVALILDVFGIAEAAGIGAGTRDEPAVDSQRKTTASAQALLLFESVGKQRLGVPLSLVDRLEEVASTRIERAGRRPVLQYRGRILPLVFVEELCGLSPPQVTTDALQLIVVTMDQRSFGLVVETISDIVEPQTATSAPVTRPGVSGCVVVQDRVTEVLDLSRAAQFVVAEPRRAAEAA
jgi:two-component system, chemotaxis family, sensor kinase CheA